MITSLKMIYKNWAPLSFYSQLRHAKTCYFEIFTNGTGTNPEVNKSELA